MDFNISHSGEFILAVFAVGMDIGVDVQEMAECPDYREIAENFYTAEEAEDVKMKDRICFPVLGGERGICKGAWDWIRKRNGFLLCQKRKIAEKDKKDQDWFLYPVRIKGYAAYVAAHKKGDR